MRNILIIPGVGEIRSGADQEINIVSLTYREIVNQGTDLILGSVCSSMIECVIRNPEGGIQLSADTEIEYYQEDAEGNRTKIGLFTLEKPTRKNAHMVHVTAYDRVSWLDSEVNAWMAGLNGWPYKLGTFAQMICEKCGLTLKTTDFPNADYEVPVFTAENITARKLMFWVGEIAARFVRADADGNIELAWYAENPGELGPTGDTYYYRGGFSYEDYETSAIKRVQISLTEDDIGVMYPEVDGPTNAYKITGNYLLTATDSAQLQPVAQTIFEQISGVSYTPCTVTIPENNMFRAGDIIKINDRNGNTIQTYVMERHRKNKRDTLRSTGNTRRYSSSALHEESYGAMNAKMLEIRKSIEGVNIKATHIQTTVEDNQKYAETHFAELDAQADAIRIEVSKTAGDLADLQENGVDRVTTAMGYTFDEEGLKIQRPDGEIMNTLDDKGMVVSRTSDGEPILEAKDNGVNALNVTVRKYLTIGNHSRIEDYSDGTDTRRTGIFWIGGDT